MQFAHFDKCWKFRRGKNRSVSFATIHKQLFPLPNIYGILDLPYVAAVAQINDTSGDVSYSTTMQSHMLCVVHKSFHSGLLEHPFCNLGRWSNMRGGQYNSNEEEVQMALDELSRMQGLHCYQGGNFKLLAWMWSGIVLKSYMTLHYIEWATFNMLMTSYLISFRAEKYLLNAVVYSLPRNHKLLFHPYTRMSVSVSYQVVPRQYLHFLQNCIFLM